MSTPHISAGPGAFAGTVLLPGDPVRARRIAERLLDEARLVTDVRNMLGYTGRYQGMPVSVMGTGMGIPSCSIYAGELVREYGVRRLVRIGTCGAVRADLPLGAIVLAQGAGTDSNANRLRFRGYDLPALASHRLLDAIARAAAAQRIAVRIGPVFSSDLFYHPDPELVPLLERAGVLGVEMEAAGLYGLAAELGVEALAVLTVSDNLRTGARMAPGLRERGVDAMTRLVLEALRADYADASTKARASGASSQLAPAPSRSTTRKSAGPSSTIRG